MSDREFFGLEDDADSKALKRAYNRKLREHPPEKDPAGFMHVRAAYERLLESMERGGSGNSSKTFDEDAGADLQAPSMPGFQWDRSLFGKPGWTRPPESAEGQSVVREGWTRWVFQDRPDAYGDPMEGGSGVFPRIPRFGPETPEEIAFPDDVEVHPIWMAFCDLWRLHRGDPREGAWKDLFDLLDLDWKFRSMFAARLAVFWRQRFLTSSWKDASKVLLWKLVVAVRWDRDPSVLEAIVGRPIADVLASWRIDAGVHSLLERFLDLAATIGWVQHSEWEKFFEWVQLDREIAQVFEPIARSRLQRAITMGGSMEEYGWILAGLQPMESESPFDSENGLSQLLRSTPHEVAVTVENLEGQDRSMLWGIALMVAGFLVFLGYQIAQRILGG